MYPCILFLIGVTLTLIADCTSAYFSTKQHFSFTAMLNTTTSQSDGKILESMHSETGWYSVKSSMQPIRGRLILVTSMITNRSDACLSLVNIPSFQWIALIARGNCDFETKINNAMNKSNASAVVIFNNADSNRLVKMKTNTPKVVSIFISHKFGLRLTNLLQLGLVINATISQGKRRTDIPYTGTLTASSTMFIAASFIVLMAILLAWVVYHYMPTLQYNYQQQRIQKNMISEMKSIFERIGTVTLTETSEEVKDDYDPCIICFENYSPWDVIKILPCQHRYHSICIEPWILRDATCPMCKLDIFEYYQTKGNLRFPTTVLLRLFSSLLSRRARRSSSHSLSSAESPALSPPLSSPNSMNSATSPSPSSSPIMLTRGRTGRFRQHRRDLIEEDQERLDTLSREETWNQSSPGGTVSQLSHSHIDVIHT